jgi:hypothetical protein
MVQTHHNGQDESVAMGGEMLGDRRKHRRHNLMLQDVAVERCGLRDNETECLGRIIDLSSGGVRIRTRAGHLRPDQQVKLRLELPAYAGICPFVDASGENLRPKTDWSGWMAVVRTVPLGDGQFEIAGRLMDMEDVDRGMLGLYLSTQPLAA